MLINIHMHPSLWCFRQWHELWGARMLKFNALRDALRRWGRWRQLWCGTAGRAAGTSDPHSEQTCR